MRGATSNIESATRARWHRRASEALASSIERAFGGNALVSSDQFLYWDPTNPKRRLAPDVAVRVGAPAELVTSWKTWERGAPHVGVEIVSDSDASELRFEEKLERYRQAGVAEVVRFDRDDIQRPIRICDLVEGDMVERDLTDPEAFHCDALGLYWWLHTDAELGVTLRLSREQATGALVLTPAEAERAAKDDERREKEAALARIAELEAEVRALRGG